MRKPAPASRKSVHPDGRSIGLAPFAAPSEPTGTDHDTKALASPLAVTVLLSASAFADLSQEAIRYQLNGIAGPGLHGVVEDDTVTLYGSVEDRLEEERVIAEIGKLESVGSVVSDIAPNRGSGSPPNGSVRSERPADAVPGAWSISEHRAAVTPRSNLRRTPVYRGGVACVPRPLALARIGTPAFRHAGSVGPRARTVMPPEHVPGNDGGRSIGRRSVIGGRRARASSELELARCGNDTSEPRFLDAGPPGTGTMKGFCPWTRGAVVAAYRGNEHVTERQGARHVDQEGDAQG